MTDDILIDRLGRATGDLLRVFKVSDRQNAADLALADLHALLEIGQTPGVTPSRLGERLSLVPATVTSTLDRLARRGLILRGRDQTDRRAIRLTLSEEGRAAFEAVEVEHRDRYARMLEALDPGQRHQFVGLMEIIAEAVTGSN